MSSPFSHLSRSVTRSGSSVTRGLFSAWSSSRHDGQPHHLIVQSMSCWWMSFKSLNKSFISKKYRKKFARSTACRRYLTRLSRKKDGAGASGSSSSITTNFRVSLGSRNRFFRCLWTKQRIFCGLAIIFSWTRGMSSPFSHWSRSVTRSGSSVTRGLFSAWSSSSLRHDGQPHKVDDRRRRTSCESKTLQAQSNAIAAPIRKAFIFNQLMHALLFSFCRYFAKIADARGAMSLSLVKCQVKKFLSAACPQGACTEAPFCVTMTVAIEFHSRALIRAHVRSRRHFAKLPLPNSRDTKMRPCKHSMPTGTCKNTHTLMNLTPPPPPPHTHAHARKHKHTRARTHTHTYRLMKRASSSC